MRSELNWVAQTAAIITEALSNEQPPSADAVDDGQGAAGGEFWMGGGSEDHQNDVSGETKPTAGGSDPSIRGLQPLEAGPVQTDCPPSQSPSTDCDPAL